MGLCDVFMSLLIVVALKSQIQRGSQVNSFRAQLNLYLFISYAMKSVWSKIRSVLNQYHEKYIII